MAPAVARNLGPDGSTAHQARMHRMLFPTYDQRVKADENPRQEENNLSGLTRREFVRRSSVLAAAPLIRASAETSHRPNVVLIISDQFRWDCIGAYGLNPVNLTPNLDAMAADKLCKRHYQSARLRAVSRLSLHGNLRQPTWSVAQRSTPKSRVRDARERVPKRRIHSQLHRQMASCS